MAAPVDIAKRPVSDDGWELQLNDGWSVKKDTDGGTYILTKLGS